MEGLGIDYRLLIAQILNFVLFLLIFKKFFAKPLTRYIAQQKTQGEEKEKLMTELKNKEQSMKEQEKEIIENAKTQASLILNDVQESAEELRKDLLQKAQSEAEHIKIQAKKSLEEDRLMLTQELKKDIIKTSALILKSTLKEIINKDMEETITEQLLQKLKTAQTTANHEN